MQRIAAAASSSIIQTPRTIPVAGYNHFLTPLRKLVIDYDPRSPAQEGVRSYLKRTMIEMARENPDIEVLVRRLRRGKAGVIRGHYVNGRDKVICVNGLETSAIAAKVDLLLNSSGAKLKPLHNLTLEAAPGGESARGIWSSVHASQKAGSAGSRAVAKNGESVGSVAGGYRI